MVHELANRRHLAALSVQLLCHPSDRIQDSRCRKVVGTESALRSRVLLPRKAPSIGTGERELGGAEPIVLLGRTCDRRKADCRRRELLHTRPFRRDRIKHNRERHGRTGLFCLLPAWRLSDRRRHID
jgi:hypothetical protein